MKNELQHHSILKAKPTLKVDTKNQISKLLLEEIESLKNIIPGKIIGIPAESGYTKAIQINILPELLGQNLKDGDILASIMLGLQFPTQYPTHVPKIDFIEIEGIPKADQGEIFQQLFDITLNMAGEAMVYVIVLKCQEYVTYYQEQAYKNKVNCRALYQQLVFEEKIKQQLESKQMSKKTNVQSEKENNQQDNYDEQTMRQQWLGDRARQQVDPEEDQQQYEKQTPKMMVWQNLQLNELLLVHLLKMVLKQANQTNYKQVVLLLQQFQISNNKELLKLISPKYEVLFNNIYLNKFDAIIKTEQEKIDAKFKELQQQTNCHSNKQLSDRQNIINLLFTPFNKSSSTPQISPQVTDSAKPTYQEQLIKPTTIIANRIETDFEIVEVLGKGAFGEVFKVKNKIDGRFYAIKKIKVPQGAALERILREVDLLSRLHHRHVIRYYQSWIDECKQNEDETYFSDEDENYCFNSGFTANSNSMYKFNSSSQVVGNSQFNVQTTTNKGKKILVLYIQTEYCTKTLRKQIDEDYKKANDAYIWNQFRQILEAMVYTHQEKIIHRDLKPENIFIDTTGDIKIGDFGLAKHTQKQNQNVVYSNSICDQSEINDILNYLAQGAELQPDDMAQLDRTLNVGTYFYCPPQNANQANNISAQFDEKRDVYALGIILFEMWFQFANNKERVKILGQLRRNGKMPKKFEEHHKRQVALIKWMLDPDAYKRPSVYEILHSEYIPPKVEDEYFLEAIKVVSTQTSQNVYYRQLIDALFKNKRISHLDRDSVMRIAGNEHRSQYMSQLVKFMQNQCVIQLTTPLLIDKPKYHVKKQDNIQDNRQIVQFMSQQGEIVFLRHQMRISFTKYLNNLNNKLLQSKCLKCYEIGEVYTNDLSQGMIKVKSQLNYDHLLFNDHTLPETIVTSVACLESLGLVVRRVRMNYEPLAIELLKYLGIYDKGAAKQIFQYLTNIVTFHSSLNFQKLKYFILNDIDSPVAKIIQHNYQDKLDKILSIFTSKQQVDSIFDYVDQIIPRSQQCNEDLKFIITTIVNVALRGQAACKLYAKIKDSPNNIEFIYDGSICASNYGFKGGFHYICETNIGEPILFGGTYHKNFSKLSTICSIIIDAPKLIDIKLDYFGTPQPLQRSNSLCLNPKIDLPLSKVQSDQMQSGARLTQVCKQKAEISGFTIELSILDEIFGDKCHQIFKYQILICSSGSNMQEAKKQFLVICQQFEIPTLMYTDDDAMSFEDQLAQVDKYDIQVLVILRDKLYNSKGKAIIRQKKDKMKKDRELSIEEFITFIQKCGLK